jgi:hypothetical protein
MNTSVLDKGQHISTLTSFRKNIWPKHLYCHGQIGLLRTIAPSVITPYVSFHLNFFAIYDFDISKDAIELVSIAIFCHNFSTCPLAGVLNITVNINGAAKVQIAFEAYNSINKILIDCK